MSSIDTAAALDAATVKLHAASDRLATLQDEERQLSDAIGELVASGDDASEPKMRRAAVREELEDLLYAQKSLATRATQAANAHQDALRAQHTQALAAQAVKVRNAAETFEAGLVALKSAHSAFVTAGQGLVTLARTGGDQFAARFSTETLADDLIQRRVYGRQNVEYDAPVPSLIAPTLAQLVN